MSSSTWTPHAVASEAALYELALWRAVEAQHVVATRALVDSVAEHELLEALLEHSKPAVPAEAHGLDLLLYTPFRYPPPLPHGSRFRGHADPGVWYGAQALRTSCAQLGYWRWRFVRDSHALRRLDAVAHTIFQTVARGGGIDLRCKPFTRSARSWSAPNEYGACQTLAHSTRVAAVQMICYRSVRDPEHGGCTAVLDARAFHGTGDPRRRQSWFLTVDRQGASWLRSGARQAKRYEFRFAP